MRQMISSLIIGRLETRPSGLFRRMQIRILMNITAEAFSINKSELRKIRGGDELENYARFTLLCMEKGRVECEKIYERAYAAGRRIRNVTGIYSRRDVNRLIFLLYSNIGINMFGNVDDEIVVCPCYFSRFYTPYQCRIMSYVDSGIISGIAGGGKLEFSQRITEGCSCCRGVLERKDD